jgi:CheY-like chemotaxis protein
VFDDEDNVRMAAGLMLEELGYSVIEAENGRIALELADAHAGKIVGAILDVRDDRGGMDGEEVLRRLRPAHPNLPVVVCTGDATEVTRMEPHGIHAVLLKPFTLEELAGAIAQAVVAPQR